jgi:hypothetical protein
MKIATFLALGTAIMAAGCSFRSETVERPAPPPTTQRTTTVYSDPYTPPTSTTTTTVTTPVR